jgi:hypothetical protein
LDGRFPQASPSRQRATSRAGGSDRGRSGNRLGYISALRIDTSFPSPLHSPLIGGLGAFAIADGTWRELPEPQPRLTPAKFPCHSPLYSIAKDKFYAILRRIRKSRRFHPIELSFNLSICSLPSPLPHSICGLVGRNGSSRVFLEKNHPQGTPIFASDHTYPVRAVQRI